MTVTSLNHGFDLDTIQTNPGHALDVALFKPESMEAGKVPQLKDDAEIDTLVGQYVDLQYLYEDLKRGPGMSRDIALEAHAIFPEFLNDNRPIEFFTVLPTKTQYNVSLEAIGEELKKIGAKIWVKVKEFIDKAIAWLHKVLDTQTHKDNESTKRMEELLVKHAPAVQDVLWFINITDKANPNRYTSIINAPKEHIEAASAFAEALAEALKESTEQVYEQTTRWLDIHPWVKTLFVPNEKLEKLLDIKLLTVVSRSVPYVSESTPEHYGERNGEWKNVSAEDAKVAFDHAEAELKKELDGQTISERVQEIRGVIAEVREVKVAPETFFQEGMKKLEYSSSSHGFKMFKTEVELARECLEKIRKNITYAESRKGYESYGQQYMKYASNLMTLISFFENRENARADLTKQITRMLRMRLNIIGEKTFANHYLDRDSRDRLEKALKIDEIRAMFTEAKGFGYTGQ